MTGTMMTVVGREGIDGDDRYALKSIGRQERSCSSWRRRPNTARICSALFTPLMTGVGPVEAGVRLGAELARLKARRRTAGSRRLARLCRLRDAGADARSIRRRSVAYRDMDASPLGFREGRDAVPRPAGCPCRCRCAFPASRRRRFRPAATIVSGAAYDAIAADMVDMETFACLRACQMFGVPLIGLRGISDGTAELQPCRRLDRISACHRREAGRCGRRRLEHGDRVAATSVSEAD